MDDKLKSEFDALLKDLGPLFSFVLALDLYRLGCQLIKEEFLHRRNQFPEGSTLQD